MLKTPGAPSKTSKRGSHLFKGRGSTAPNTPEDDEKAGVTVMANEYDPSQEIEALASTGNVPSSPLRKDTNSVHAEEEKKESEDAAATAEVGAGVDVVSKILANFDDICAVPKDPKHKQQASSIASSKSGKKEEFSHPEWGREPSMDGDETTTNPSLSLPSESSDPYSSAYTNSTSMMMGPDRRGVIKKSPSQDHENFEVVLDPTSLLSDDDEEPAAPKQRRWPFSNPAVPKGTTVEQMKTPAVPPPIIEEDMTEETPDPLIPDGNLPSPADDGAIKVESNDAKDSTTKRGVPKKSLVKRSWKSCKKLIAKASGADKEPKQEHVAEVDNEAQHTESLEQQKLEVETNSVKTGNDRPIDKENLNVAEESSEDNTQKVPDSTTNVWNSFVASIAGTFDPEVAAATAVEEIATEDSMSPVEEEKLPEEDQLETVDKAEESLPVEVTAGKEVKEKAKPRSSLGWKGFKSIKKSAKSLVKAPKKEIVSDQAPLATSSKSDLPTESVVDPSSDVKKMPLRKPKAVWKAVEDKDSGKTYYYHRMTRETTWSKPFEYQQYETDLQKWKAAQATENASQHVGTKVSTLSDKSSVKEKAITASMSGERPNSPRVASWPSSAPKSDAEEKKNANEVRRIATPPARTVEKDAVVASGKPAVEQGSTKSNVPPVTDKKEASNWERRKEVERLLNSLPSDKSRKSVDHLMKEYAGKEDTLVKELRAKVESQPLEETRPFDEPINMAERKRSAPPRSPHRFGQRTMTYMSKASATTRSSALTDRTEKIKNTGKGKLSPFVPINETLSSATSISSHNEDDKYLSSMAASPARRVPSRVPVPRERQLMVEELTDSRISAESYEGNGGKRGRIVRGRAREPVQTQLDTVYDGDNDDNTDDDNTASLYDNDTYGTDSVSALSENDTDFIQRKDNFEQARRRALDDAIEREDWDLAAALSEGMRAANMPGGYERAHTSWNQSELDKFIANNDWSAVKNYIARMREKSQTSANKSIGARSQLQHKELMSESSWTSDSQSSYSYDSESEI